MKARVLRFVAVYIVTVDAQQLSILMTIYISAIPAVKVAMPNLVCILENLEFNDGLKRSRNCYWKRRNNTLRQ